MIYNKWYLMICDEIKPTHYCLNNNNNNKQIECF
jgi:hypothetical protein